ncbi:MAG: tRNA (adenosine(37)-N6)-threonylcarbamoyltransferase complex transferase subunit TsaD, partial [Oscillospiraceae bacterium]
TDILAEKLLLAARDSNADKICIAGGVAANTRLRETLEKGAKKLGAKLYLPEISLCGDNGAMIAAQGFYEYNAGNIANLRLNGVPTLSIDYEKR